MQGLSVPQTALTPHMYAVLSSSHRKLALDSAYVRTCHWWQNRKGQSSRPVHWLLE